MSTVNYSNPNVDNTVKIFDQFYSYSANVPAMEYDAVYSYFNSVFTSALAAGNFTVTLFRIAQENSISVMDLLQQLRGKSAPELSFTMAYYLNQNRSKSTLLGIKQSVVPNYYVAKNIIQ